MTTRAKVDPAVTAGEKIANDRWQEKGDLAEAVTQAIRAERAAILAIVEKHLEEAKR